jgi:hypothetical protein
MLGFVGCGPECPPVLRVDEISKEIETPRMEALALPYSVFEYPKFFI